MIMILSRMNTIYNIKMEYTINKQKITNTEVQSFINTWLENTNDIVDIGGAKINNADAKSFYEQFLKAFVANKNLVRIFGVDIMQGFEICLSNKKHILKICDDIYKNPRNYYNIPEGADEYYEFSKYIWINYLDTEIRLVELYSDTETEAMFGVNKEREYFYNLINR